jgi:hypothetical protein
MPEVTDWYPGHIKPLKDRPGEYECDWCIKLGEPVICREFWDGKKWRLRPDGYVYITQKLSWRGLSAPQGE